MIYERNFDQAILGKNYASLLLAIRTLQIKKRVILVDDKRLGVGEHYLNRVTPFDITFLKFWLNDLMLSSKINLESCLKESPLLFHLQSINILTGLSPSANMIEFGRKFYNVLGPSGRELTQELIDKKKSKTFDEEFLLSLEKLSRLAFYSDKGELKIKDIEKALGPKMALVLKESYQLFYPHFAGDVNLRIFFYALSSRYFYTHNLSYTYLDFALLLVTFLSPLYTLDSQKLELELEKEFLSIGGILRETKVTEWQFYGKNPWALGLDSIEGAIHPGEVVCFGHQLSRILPISIGQGTFYKRYTLKIPCPNIVGEEKKKCFQGIFIREKGPGTQYPYWEYCFDFDGFVELSLSVAFQEGQRPEFFVKEFEKMVSEFREIVPLRDWDVDQNILTYLVESKDVTQRPTPWFGNPKGLRHKDNRGAEISYRGEISDRLGFTFKNARYMGPLAYSRLGLGAMFLKMKEGVKEISYRPDEINA